jgi:prophage regulatory protein
MSDAALCTEAAIGRLLRRPEVERETGMSRSTIYRLMDEGEFPRPLRTGHRMVAWSSTAIDAWKASRAITKLSEM